MNKLFFWKKIVFPVFLYVLSANGLKSMELSPVIEYILSMPEPHTHYFEVKMEISAIQQEFIDCKMPVWAPGSYKIRDFSKNVDFFKVIDKEGKPLKFEKMDKHTWRVYTNKKKALSIAYKVYAFERSVRTSFLDISHGFVDGSSIFMYIDEMQHIPSTLTIHPYEAWTKVTTSLKETPGSKWRYKVASFDELADSPIEIGNHEVFTFVAAGISHEVAMYGEGNYEKDRLLKDIKKIVEVSTAVFGENPVKNYTFIIHNQDKRTGGLEHANSTTLQVNRWSYQPESTYISKILGLIAHEYFHLWNVKRLKPQVLTSINYEQESYTRLLWMMEGFTRYYDGLIVRRAGFVSRETFLGKLAQSITAIENQPGNLVQPVAEASFDAWIKAYQPGENSFNTTISYYQKGGVLAAMLDLEILHSTEGTKNLDDVMRHLFRKYYVEEKKGITNVELQRAIEQVTGKSMEDFFNNYIYGSESVNYNQFLAYGGLLLEKQAVAGDEVFFGISTEAFPNALGKQELKANEGKLIVAAFVKGSTAYDGGVNVGDEIIAVDGYRVDADLFEKMIQMKKIGEEIKLTVARDGIMVDLNILLKASPYGVYSIKTLEKTSEKQMMISKKWLELANLR